MLEFIREIERNNKGGQKYALYRCMECKERKEVIKLMTRVKAGHVKSCGCLRKKNCRELFLSHGMSESLEYNAWRSMKYRCYCKSYKCYNNYNSKGITVCERWLHSFENFFSDMGPKPSPELTIERRNNNGNYEPENCYWGTDEEQANNKSNNVRYKYKGKYQTLSRWARELGYNASTLHKRIIDLNWSIEKALTTPIEVHRKIYHENTLPDY